MKRSMEIAAMVLMLLLTAGNFSLNAQREWSDMTGKRNEHRHKKMRIHSDSLTGLVQHYAPCVCQEVIHMHHGPGTPQHIIRHSAMPGHSGMIGSIPGLTENQKKEIADLDLKQQKEIHEFREVIREKTKEIRESHRNKIMSLLTDEQKKWVEENRKRPE
jgi:Spy/CpxP family protein refolding chaperone